MPAYSSRKRVSSYDDGDKFVASDNDNNNNNGDTSTQRPTKKSRTTALATDAAIKDTDGNLYWEISKQRRVTISEFKGTTLVNIREYYEKDGKELPGKKGISMSLAQYSTFVEILPQIEKVLKDKGETVPRPQYSKGRDAVVKKENGDGNGDEDEEMDGDVEKGKKSNFEATSDEDEGE